jgi:hypothetical protein
MESAGFWAFKKLKLRNWLAPATFGWTLKGKRYDAEKLAVGIEPLTK